jgi:hypothetical protein
VEIPILPPLSGNSPGDPARSPPTARIHAANPENQAKICAEVIDNGIAHDFTTDTTGCVVTFVFTGC